MEKKISSKTICFFRDLKRKRSKCWCTEWKQSKKLSKKKKKKKQRPARQTCKSYVAFTLQAGKFKNAAWLLRSTARPTFFANPANSWNFSKTLIKPEEFENAAFSFSNEDHSEDDAEKNGLTKIMWFHCLSFTIKQILNDQRLLRFQISPAGVSVDGKCSLSFRSETSGFKFLWRSVRRSQLCIKFIIIINF